MKQKINPWLRYVDRTYTQIIASVQQAISVNGSLNTLITNLGLSDLFFWFVSIYAGIAEMLGIYIDNNAREIYITQTRRYQNANILARSKGYRPRGANAASVVLRFSLPAPLPNDLLIPIFTQVSTDLGIIFLTIENVTLLAGETQVFANASQYERLTNQVIGVTDGTAYQELVIDVPVGKFLVDNSVEVEIELQPYTRVRDFLTAYQDGFVFQQTVNQDKLPIITFGDGIKGVIPPAFVDVLATSYLICLGEQGNVAPNTITNIDSVIVGGADLEVTNLAEAVGGAGYEELQDLRTNVPTFLRTQYGALERAVTAQDYSDVAEQVAGVQSAFASFDCAKEISIFVIPTGVGFVTPQLRTEIVNYFDLRKILGRKVIVRDAGRLKLFLDVRVRRLPNTNPLQLLNEIRSRLIAFCNPPNQTIGNILALGDLYEQVETTEGVENSRVARFYVLPAPIAVEDIAPPLIWSVSVTEAITTAAWKIKFTNATSFTFFEGTTFVGTFNVGDTVTYNGLSFVVTANSYIGGTSYTFNTYTWGSDIDINEPSVITLAEADLFVTFIN